MVGIKRRGPRALPVCPHLGRGVACCPTSPRCLREQRPEMKDAQPHFPALPDPEGAHTASQPALWASFPSLASHPLHTPPPRPLHRAAQLTCQRLRARRNFSCLVLMKWASSAGTDFWGSPGERGMLRGDPGAPCGPGRPPFLLASFSLPVSQASPCLAYSPGTKGGQGTWRHWAGPCGERKGGISPSGHWSKNEDLRQREGCVYSLHGLLQSSLDKALGILTEVGGHGATPGHPPFQDIQKGCSVTLASKWGRAGQAESRDMTSLQSGPEFLGPWEAGCQDRECWVSWGWWWLGAPSPD